jgi:hypothetical protein
MFYFLFFKVNLMEKFLLNTKKQQPTMGENATTIEDVRHQNFVVIFTPSCRSQ